MGVGECLEKFDLLRKPKTSIFILVVHTIINEDIGFSGIVGLQNFQYQLRGAYGEESSFTNPDEVFINFGNATSENSNITDYTRKNRKSGAYAVLNFDFWDQVLLEITGRAEYLSSIPDRGLIFYPSASVGWDFSSYVDTGVISFGKIRASYGEVGIEPVPYSAKTVFSTGGILSSWGDGFDGSLYGNPLTRSAARGNPDLKEERKKSLKLEWIYAFSATIFPYLQPTTTMRLLMDYWNYPQPHRMDFHKNTEMLLQLPTEELKLI